MNTYIIIEMTDPNLDLILEECVCYKETLRKSIDQTKCVAKLPVNSSIPPILQGYQSYSHGQILSEISKPDWTLPDLI